jgi:long-subunit acyl-CoA synthetase (AMP-forming)
LPPQVNARTDSVILLNNGEKVSPDKLEDQLVAIDDITDAIVCLSEIMKTRRNIIAQEEFPLSSTGKPDRNLITSFIKF